MTSKKASRSTFVDPKNHCFSTCVLWNMGSMQRQGTLCRLYVENHKVSGKGFFTAQLLRHLIDALALLSLVFRAVVVFEVFEMHFIK